MKWLAPFVAAVVALGCWYDVPDLASASGSASGSGSGGGGGSVAACSANAPVLTAVASAITFNTFAATEDGVVGIGFYDAPLPCAGKALPVPGTGQTNTFVAHLDASGACTWAFALVSSIGAAYLSANTIALDAAGSIYVGGDVGDSAQIDGIDTPAGVASTYVLKTDSHGSASPGHGYLALQPQSGSASVSNQALAVSPNGEVTIAGAFSGTWDTGVGKLSGGGFAMHLDTNGSPVWAKDFVLYTGSATGELLIDRLLPGSGGDVVLLAHGGSPTTTDFDGNLLKGPGNGIAMKLDAHGKQLWANTFGGIQQYVPLTGGALDALGNVAVTGVFLDGSFVGDGTSIAPVAPATYFFAMLDGATGRLTHARALGGGSADAFSAPQVAFDAAGQDAWLAEGLIDPVNLGCGPLEPGGAGDVVLAELASDGTTLFADRYGKGGKETVLGISRSPKGIIRVVGAFEGTPFPLTIGKSTLKKGPAFIATIGAP